MNKSILVAVFLIVVVAVNQSYGAPMQKRTMADALNSQLMSQGTTNLQRQALLNFLQSSQRRYGDFSIRAPEKRVTADAYMNSAMRQQFYNSQGSALRQAILKLQAQRGDFGKRSQDDVDFE